MFNWEKNQYVDIINRILKLGESRNTRAGEAFSLFGESIIIDLQSSGGFPLLQGRKLNIKPIAGELAALLRGPKHIDDFKKFGCNYWDSWGDKDGNLVLDYGNTWIDFNGVNQLKNLVDTLLTNPTDRRMIITGWKPDNLDKLSLPCCHTFYQWYVRDGVYLDMIWYQRSADVMVGLPSDIVLASLWNTILAKQCGYEPGMVKMILADTHIYENHLDGARKYLEQVNSIDYTYKVTCDLDKSATVFNFTPDMVSLSNYSPKETIKFNLNV